MIADKPVGTAWERPDEAGQWTEVVGYFGVVVRLRSSLSTLHLLPQSPHRAVQANGATAAYFNRAVYERLKPGGSYVIVDHAAVVGAGTNDAQSLHRIEPAPVREEVEAACFVLDAESTMLANKDDAHSIKVFEPSIKGETDRFVYRFVKR